MKKTATVGGLRLLFDIETDGLLNTLSKIHCIVLKNLDDGIVWSGGPDDIQEGLEILANADLIIGHNIIGFDIPAIQKLYPNWKPRGVVRDTQVLCRLIWPDLKEHDLKSIKKKRGFPPHLIGRHSLKAWGYRLGCRKGEYAETTDWQHWTPELQAYCEQDVEVTHKLWDFICAKQPSPESVELEHRFAEVIFRQEQHGFPFDVEKAQALDAKLRGRKADLKDALQVAFPPWEETQVFIPKVNNKTMGYIKGEPFTKVKLVSFNPASRDHIADRLIQQRGWEPDEFTDTGKPKVDEIVLAELDYPEAKLLNEYLLTEKRLGQLSNGKNAWLKLVKNGRIHGTVNTNGAVTGRCTHAKPNIAQVPKEHDYRELFTPPPGWALVGADLAGLELRCLAHFMARYDGGAYAREIVEGDVHWTNTIALGLIPAGTVRIVDYGPHENQRDKAKEFVYAYLYGAGDEKIGSIIGKGPLAGKELKKRFLAKTPALKRLQETVKEAARKGYILGLDGRRLNIRSQHAALNTLLQSAGALISKKATCLFIELCDKAGLFWGTDYALVAHVHDEMQIACRKELADEIGTLAVRSFQLAGEHFKFRCPIDGQYKIGANWAETH